ncbi:MAG: phosphate--acyl-ACP acyltransferase, partial [Ginsengibacter sp.]
MNIALDMMGGDFTPLEAVKGVQLFYSQPHDVNLILIGDEQKIKPLLSEYKISSENIKVVHAAQVIEMHEHPTKALK